MCLPRNTSRGAQLAAARWINPDYEQEDEQPKSEPEFSRNATGFLAWLQQKTEKLGNTFEVRWCGMQSFGGKKMSKEEIMTWVAELVNVEQVEWVDEEKKSFRLLND